MSPPPPLHQGEQDLCVSPTPPTNLVLRGSWAQRTLCQKWKYTEDAFLPGFTFLKPELIRQLMFSSFEDTNGERAPWRQMKAAGGVSSCLQEPSSSPPPPQQVWWDLGRSRGPGPKEAGAYQITEAPGGLRQWRSPRAHRTQGSSWYHIELLPVLGTT